MVAHSSLRVQRILFRFPRTQWLIPERFAWTAASPIPDLTGHRTPRPAKPVQSLRCEYFLSHLHAKAWETRPPRSAWPFRPSPPHFRPLKTQDSLCPGRRVHRERQSADRPCPPTRLCVLTNPVAGEPRSPLSGDSGFPAKELGRLPFG